MPRARRNRAHPDRAGFTLIEILSVVVIIGILIGILLPSVGGVTNSAKRAKTRVQFSQWATAIEGFRQEYGYYPDFTDTGSLINDHADAEAFVATLSGRDLETGNPAPGKGNTKHIAFCSFGPDDLTSEAQARLRDAFGNTEIALLIDKNYDGIITVGTDADYSSDGVPPVKGTNASTAFSPFSSGPNPPRPIRASVIFYSAGAGKSDADIVKSWE